VDGGLTPLEALQSATLNAAEYLGQSETSGSVEVGRVADLVILQSNPLEDIAHTRSIVGVVLDGTYIGPEELSAMGERIRSVLESLRSGGD